MKLRTTHNSIRVRIRKSELTSLADNKLITESICFPTGILFRFSLKIDNIQKMIHAELENNHLVLSIEKNEAMKWISTNQVGIETNIKLEENEFLHLLIEKDFPCLDRPEEDKSDTFWELAPENPDAC